MSCGPVFFPRSIGPVLIDVVISETCKSEMEIPSHPVERGAKISDHVWRLQDELLLSCVNEDVTNTYRALKDLMALAEPFDIVSGWDLHENMIIEKIEVFRDAATSRILALEVKLSEIITVETGEGTGNAGTGGDPRGQGMTNRGQVQARKVDTSSGRAAAVAKQMRAGR